ncbi:unnamed protein product, partial [Vitis vinifera]
MDHMHTLSSLTQLLIRFMQLFERYREVISTLPKEKGWTTEHLYQYQGCWYRTTSGIQGVIWMQEHFKPRPADVLLVTPPKSGTTWFKALLFAIMNRTQFNTSTHPLLTTNSQCRIVYVSRNPKDVFAFEQYCKGFSPYGPFWDHILGYWKANSKWPERVLLLKYEDMKRDSSFHLKRIAEFIGQPFSSEEEKQGLVHEIIKLCSFESLSNMKVNKTGTFRAGYLTVDKNSFFRKGEVGDWKNHLTAEMAERLDKITERNLDGFSIFLALQLWTINPLKCSRCCQSFALTKLAGKQSGMAKKGTRVGPHRNPPSRSWERISK